MEISASEAQESLEQAQDAAERTKKMLAYAGGDTLFIVWGVIWVVGFVATHFLGLGFHSARTLAAHTIWSVLLAAGIVITIIVGRRHAPVQSPIGRRVGWFWGCLYAYVCLWIGLLWPFIKVEGPADQWQVFGKHLGAIGATVPMFAYVVTGLWLDHFMLWLGLGVTALAVLGLFLLQPYFWLWMAATGGGTLMATGLLIRNRWR